MQYVPDLKINKIYEIDKELLKKLEVKALILDIDNTLTTHGNPVPADGIVNWVAQMKADKVPMVIVSNNSHNRVRPFAGKLGIPFIANGKKPLKGGLRRAVKQFNLQPQQICVVGDQLFTDILGGNRLGMKTILVTPFEEETGRFFKIKRKLEQRLMRKYRSKNEDEYV